MIIKLYILTLIVYSSYAALPFLNLGKNAHFALGITCAIIGSMAWITISRSVPKNEISLYGLIFDVIITFSFFLVPFLLSSQGLSKINAVGCALLVIGLILVKL